MYYLVPIHSVIKSMRTCRWCETDHLSLDYEEGESDVYVSLRKEELMQIVAGACQDHLDVIILGSLPSSLRTTLYDLMADLSETRRTDLRNYEFGRENIILSKFGRRRTWALKKEYKELMDNRRTSDEQMTETVVQFIIGYCQDRTDRKIRL